MNLPILYKATKTGAIQQWSVSAGACQHDNEAYIIVTQGQVDGAMQDYPTLIREGKNVGKANETTPLQQAESEAASKWAKKVKSGYTEDPSGEITVELPMKVKVFQDQLKNVAYPASGLPKMDGVNGTWKRDSNRELTLWSRGGEQYPSIIHMMKEVHETMDDLMTNTLACEIYCHGMHLQDIAAGVKKFNKKYTPQLQCFVFDIPEYGATNWVHRGHELLCGRAAQYFNQNKHVFITPCIRLNNEGEAWAYHKFCVENKYEGIIVNNFVGKYEYNIRSSNAFKLKIQLDAEYKCIGYKIDKSGHPVLQCITAEGHEFWPKPEGDAERKAAILEVIDTEWVGQWIKIKYEKLSKKLIPQKPIAEGPRKCDENGEPLE